jgi:hypothetical protein
MGILEEINYMRSQGMGDREIFDDLQEKGATPKEINDALSQMKIKSAIFTEDEGPELEVPTPIPKGERISSQTLYVPKSVEIETNQPEEFYTPPHMEELEAPQYEESSNEEYYPQQGYEEAEGESYDADTFIEIAEQVFSEKIKKEQNQIEALNEFATLAETKISNNHERIKRIEAVIDKLQIAILEKIGSYGKNLESIKNEMEMMQNSFEKIVPKLHEINSENKRKRSSQ